MNTARAGSKTDNLIGTAFTVDVEMVSCQARISGTEMLGATPRANFPWQEALISVGDMLIYVGSNMYMHRGSCVAIFDNQHLRPY